MLGKVSIPHKQIYPKPGWVEHDAEEIFQNVLGSVERLFESNLDSRDEILCLSMTNQRETIVVFDRQTGAPLYHAIVWQCRRGSEICKNLVAEGKDAIVRRKTGLPIDTYFSASKLKWLVENSPEIRSKLDAGEALIGTIETYLIYRLTDGQSFVTDHTNACRTLLYDINNLCWDEELCEIFNVPIKALPEVRESSAQFGKTDLKGLLADPLPICGVMGDSQAALFAERGFDPGSAKVTLGSGSSVLLNIGSEPKHAEKGVVTTLAWVYEEQPTYAFEGIINFTGATIAWLKDQVKIIDDAGDTEMLAKSVEDNSGVYLVPAFVGLSAPYWRADVKAAILGMTPHTTKAHIARAALEAVVYRIKDVLGLMSDEANLELTCLHADGGMVRNQFLLQFLADLLNIRVRVSDLPEVSALGAVMAGLLGMGQIVALEDLQTLPFESVDYLPEMPQEKIELLYAGWQKAVRQVLATFIDEKD